MAANVSDKIALIKSPVVYNAQTQTGTIEIKLKNIGAEDLTYPIKIIVKKIFYTLDSVELNGDSNVNGADISCVAHLTGTPDQIDLETFAGAFGRTDFISPSVTEPPIYEMTNGDGFTSEGRPYLIYTVENSQQTVLAPGQETAPLSWKIKVAVEAYQEARSFHINARIFSGDDTIAPELQIREPGDGAEIKEVTPAVMINFRDEDSGINTSSLTVTANGIDITSDFIITETGATGQLSNALPYNANSIVAGIADNAGNISTAQVGFTVQPDTDSDNDGMPDWWEMKYFGDLTTYQGADDYDGDGISNTDEYNNGTDPKNSDITAPVILNQYPPEGQQPVPTEGKPFEMIYSFADEGSGIKSVLLLDENGVDITNTATLSDNSITLSIKNPLTGMYQFILILTDMAGNKTEIPISFALDSEPPSVFSDHPGGQYNTPLTLSLISEQGVDIYYSTDGYPPFMGASNTIKKTSPAQDITITRTTHLQFFAVDAAGNAGAVESEIYYLDKMLSAPPLTVGYSAGDPTSALSWTSVPEAAGYHIYRVINPIDKAILETCISNKIPPPSRLRIMAGIIGTSATDSGIIPGTTYWYGLSIKNQEGLEGPLTELVPLTTGGSSVAQNKTEAIQRAKIWLKANQEGLGFWGNNKNNILATSQVLNAFKAAGEDDAAIRNGLFYLRGHDADNNDFLARKIITLSLYGQNVDPFVARLIPQAMIEGTIVRGWGITKGYLPDPMDTVLASIAAEKTTRPFAYAMNGLPYLLQNYYGYFWSSDHHCFGWIKGGARSVYVSSFIYNILWKKYTPAQLTGYSSAWIIDGQTGNGALGNGLMDTAAALLWLDIPAIPKSNALAYMISEQSPNGSWKGDPYLTGLCLEALLKQPD